LSFDLSPQLIAANLLGVVGVQLAQKLGDEKGVEEKLSRADGALLEPLANFGRVLAALKDEDQVHEHAAWKDISFYRGGEPIVFIGLQEVLPVTSIIKEMIVQSADAEDIEAAAREEGMLTLLEDALFKAAQGRVSIEEVEELASE
jgi:type IV pilus assembly protein PilB